MAILLGQAGPGVDGANSNGAGIAFAQRLQASGSGTVTTIALKCATSAGASLRGAIYADSAGNITGSARLSEDNVFGTVTNGIFNVLTLATPVPVVSGTFYWIEFVGVGSALNYTNFAASGGTERDTTGIATLAATHPTQGTLNANVANCYGDGVLVASAPSSPILTMLARGGYRRALALSLIVPRQVVVAAAVPADLLLETAAGTSTATLSLTAPTQVPLGTAAAQSSASLALTAPTQVPLATAACQSAATLALTAPTRVPLAASAAQSTGTLALTAPALLRLSAITYPSEVLADSPVGYWRLGDPSGTTATDSSGNARPGTYVGTPTLGAVGGLNGDADTAVTFSGAAGQHIDVPHDAAFALTTNFTLECLVKPTDRAAYYFLVTKDITNTPSPFEWRLTITNGKPALFPGGSQGTVAPATGVWSHLAVTFDGTTHTHYLNGVENGVFAGTPGTDGGGPLQIATRADGLSGFKGGLDEVAIYNTVLSPARILAHSNAGLAVSAIAQSAATLAVTVPGVATVPLDPAAAVSTGTLALTAQTQIPLGVAAAQSAATLALTAQTTVALGIAAAQSTGTLNLTATTKVVLGTAAAVSTATLSLTAPTRVVLGTSTAQTSATLSLTAQTYVLLGTSTAQSTGTLAVFAPSSTIPMQPSVAVSNATLAVTAQTQIPLQASTATAAGTLALRAATRVVLAASSATSTGTLVVFTPSAALVVLGAANANSTGTLVLVQMGRRWPAHTGPRWGMDPSAHWTPPTEDRWAAATGGRWPMDPQSNW